MATAVEHQGSYSLPQEFLDFRETIRKIVVERVAPRAAEIDEKAEYPQRPSRAVRLARPVRPAVRDRARRHRDRDPDAQHRGRGGRQGVRLERPDADDPGARDAADQAVRHRRAEAALPARVRDRRVDARRSRSRSPTPARTRAGMRTQGRPRRRRVGDRRNQELDHQPRRRRLLHRVRASPTPSAGHSHGISAFVVEADRPGFSVGKLEHKMGIRGSPTGQPIFDDVRVPGGEPDRRARTRASRSRWRRSTARASASPRRRVGIAQGATDYAAAYAQERQQFGKPIAALPGHPVQARRHGVAHRGGARAALPRLREGRRRRAATWASTRRWRSCSPPTPRWG